MRKLAVLVCSSLMLLAVAACSESATASPTKVSSNSNNSAAETRLGAAPVNGSILYKADSLQQSGIWVSGQGVVTAKADIAVLSLGVQTQAKTVADAMSQASDKMNQVMQALKGSGIADKDIMTSQFSINPIYSQIQRDPYTQPLITGYNVTNMVTAKIRKLDTVGPVIDKAATAGGDATRVNGIGFQVEDTNPILKQARDLAIKDALARAQQLAAGAGVQLGKAVYISENSGYSPSPVQYSLGAAKAEVGAPTPISPGEQQMSVSVQVGFTIL